VIAFGIGSCLSTVHLQSVPDPPPRVIRTAIPMLLRRADLADVSISMTRVLVGFISGSLVGIVHGVLLANPPSS